MSTAGDLIDDSRQYAANTLINAIAEMNSAITILQGLGRSLLEQNLPQLPIDPPLPGDPGPVPQYHGPHFILPIDLSVSPNLVPVPPFDLPLDPGGAPTVPDFNQPPKPTGPQPDTSLLVGAPTFALSDFTLQDPPDLLAEIHAIPAPVILPLSIPSSPGFVQPSFDGTPPDPVAGVPAGIDAASWRVNFSTASDMMRAIAQEQLDSFIDREFPQFRAAQATLEDKLNQYLATGNILPVAVESAMFQRTISRNDAEARRARRQVLEAGAAEGWSIPPISLLNQSKDLDQDRRDKNAQASTDIYIEQNKIAQGNLQFALTTSARMRETAINAAIAYYTGMIGINRDALEYARGIVDTIVKAYGLAIQRSEIQARIYEAQAAVYRARVEGALAVIQAYEAQIRAVEAEANVDRALVDVYRSRIDAVQAEANVFRAATEVVVARATVARTLTEVYQSKVQAYGAEVNAKTAEWQGYVAAVQGETARIAGAVEQVRGFQARVQAFDAEIRARTAAVESAVRTNLALTQVYATQLEAFRTKVMGQAEAIRAEINSYDETIKAFVASAQAIEAKSRATLASFEVRLRAVVEQAHIFLEQIREQHNLDIHRVEGMARVAVAAGEIFANQSAAAVAGMNSLAAQIAQE